MAQQKTIGTGYPALTIAVIGFSLVVAGWPRLSDLLVFDRQAVLEGEWWRLLTAPFVHFSSSHLWWDLLVFSAAGWVVEMSGYRGFWIVCVFSAVMPGLFFLLTSPDLARYGGLSGLAVGAVAYLCLNRAGELDRKRTLWLAVLALMAVKIVVETGASTPLFVRTESLSFRVLPSVHAIGYIGALIGLLWTRFSKEQFRRTVLSAYNPLQERKINRLEAE
jgi:rhomboid family GlyGly-CTERM serine protease